jgi:hypothetical protein
VQLVPGTKGGGRKSGGFSMTFARVQPVPDDLRSLVALRLAGACEVLRTPFPAPREELAPKGKRGKK